MATIHDLNLPHQGPPISSGLLALVLQMTINYLSLSGIEDELIREAHQIHLEKRLGVYRIKAKNPSGKFIADCSGAVYHKQGGLK